MTASQVELSEETKISISCQKKPPNHPVDHRAFRPCKTRPSSADDCHQYNQRSGGTGEAGASKKS